MKKGGRALFSNSFQCMVEYYSGIGFQTFAELYKSVHGNITVAVFYGGYGGTLHVHCCGQINLGHLFLFAGLAKRLAKRNGEIHSFMVSGFSDILGKKFPTFWGCERFYFIAWRSFFRERLDALPIGLHVSCMGLHLIKLVVGVETLEEFADWQERSRVTYDGAPANAVWTRHRPKQADELLNGGSIYRVIKNRIVCRQKIIGFEEAQDPVKGKMCLVMVDPEIMTTVSAPHRPFQGWRYLKPEAAPKDKGVFSAEGDQPPGEMEEDLRAAGLL